MSSLEGGAGARHTLHGLLACTQCVYSVLRWRLFHFIVTVQLKMGVLHHVVLIVTVISRTANSQTPCELVLTVLMDLIFYNTLLPLSDPYCTPVCGNPSDNMPVTFGCQVPVGTEKCSDLNVWLVNKTAVNASSPRYSITNHCSDGHLTTSLTFFMNESNYGCYRCANTTTFQIIMVELTLTCYEPICIGTGCNSSSPFTTHTLFSPCVLLMAVLVVCCVALFAFTVSYHNHWIIGANQQKHAPHYYKLNEGKAFIKSDFI